MPQQILQFELWGKQFSPKAAEEKTGLELSYKVEPGQIGKYGRYKNKPTPYGAASLRTPSDWSWDEKFDWLFNQMEKHIETFKKCGAEDIQLDQAYYFENQCNIGFSAEELKRIADLEIDFSISCYQEEKKPTV